MTEKEELFKQLQEFVLKHGKEYETVEEAVNAFFQMMEKEKNITRPSNFASFKREKVSQLFESLPFAETEKEYHSILKEILEVDPENVDARFLSLDSEASDYLKKLEKLVAETERDLQKRELISETDIGSYGFISEARPFLRMKHALSAAYQSCRMKRKAVRELEELLLLDKTDRNGVRYDLMGLYNDLEEFEKAEALFQQYGEEDVFLLLPLTILRLKTGDELGAKRFYKILQKSNRNVQTVFGKPMLDLDAWADAAEEENVVPGSREEIYQAMEYAADDFLLEAGDYYFDWLRKNINKSPKKK